MVAPAGVLLAAFIFSPVFPGCLFVSFLFFLGDWRLHSCQFAKNDSRSE